MDRSRASGRGAGRQPGLSVPAESATEPDARSAIAQIGRLRLQPARCWRATRPKPVSSGSFSPFSFCGRWPTLLYGVLLKKTSWLPPSTEFGQIAKTIRRKIAKTSTLFSDLGTGKPNVGILVRCGVLGEDRRISKNPQAAPSPPVPADRVRQTPYHHHDIQLKDTRHTLAASRVTSG